MLTDDAILVEAKNFLGDLLPAQRMTTTELVNNICSFTVDKSRAFSLLKREASRSLAAFATRGPEEPFTRFHPNGTKRPWLWHAATEPNDEYEGDRPAPMRLAAASLLERMAGQLDRIEALLLKGR